MRQAVISSTNRRQVFKQIAATLGGAVIGAKALAVATNDPILALIAEENRLRWLGSGLQDKALVMWRDLPDHLRDHEQTLDEIDAIQEQGDTIIERAGVLYDQIKRTKARSIEGAIAQIELLIDDPVENVAIIVAGLRSLTVGDAA